MQARDSFGLAMVTAALALGPSPAVAQKAFEGVVTFQVNAGRGGPQTMEYSIKGKKVRMDISTGGINMFTLFDGSAKTVDMVIPMRQMYMERSAADASSMADSAASHVKVDWTGKMETVAGYKCEHANVTDADGQTTDVCLAKDLGSFMSMGGGMGRGGPGGWEELIGQAFPLKVIDGNGTVELEAIKIEKKSLDNSMFTIPNGYQKMEMPGGGRGGR